MAEKRAFLNGGSESGPQNGPQNICLQDFLPESRGFIRCKIQGVQCVSSLPLSLDLTTHTLKFGDKI